MPLSDPDAELSFRELVDASPDGVLVCNERGIILLVNKQAEHMFGYDRAELVGKPIEDLIPERFRARHPSHVARYVSAPKVRPMGSGLELFGRRRDGSEFPVEISLSPIHAPTGRIVSAAIRDVTDRKRIEADARRANAFLVSAVDSIQDAFALYDEDDRVVLVNSTFRNLLARDLPGPILGWRFDEMVDQLIAAGRIELDGEDPDAFKQRWIDYHRAPNGSIEIRTQGHALRIVDRPTAEHGTVSLLVDVTEDRARATELRRAREQAEAASAAKSEFLSSMSHELRTPLNAVLGFAQLLQRDKKEPLSGRQLERIDHVLRGGEHLLRLIDEVLDLSRIEAGGVTISAEPVELDGVIAEVMTTLDPMAQRAGVALATARAPGGPRRVIADRTRLAQILMNFGSNAIKYNRAGGHVRFESELRPEQRCRITVIDDGIGIPEDKRAKLFEPFQRAGQETGPIQGTGIGLAISKRLAELMQGSVGYTTEPGRGSRFWIEIPSVQTGDAAIATALSPASGTALAGTTRHKIVYVEDNPSNIAFMRELMDDLPSIELLTAPTAEIGIELVRGHRPAIVIMDINLPGMSGVEATRLLSSYPETQHIPVIALTAAALLHDARRNQAAGFYRYLTKPVKVDELIAVLEELLERAT